MTPLERRCRWLLRAYPGWYRRGRGEEMLGTLLEASPPGRSWPSFRDARALIIGGLRVRGWVWLLSMLWVAAGTVVTGYSSTPPCPITCLSRHCWYRVDRGQRWSCSRADRRGPGVCRVGGAVSIHSDCRVHQASRLAAGQLAPRGARGQVRGLRAGSCCGWPWLGGECGFGWGELAICAAWLVLGGLMTWILAVPPPASARFREAGARAGLAPEFVVVAGGLRCGGGRGDRGAVDRHLLDRGQGRDRNRGCRRVGRQFLDDLPVQPFVPVQH